MKNFFAATALFFSLSGFSAAKMLTKAVDQKQSVINWTGEKILGKHHGTLTFKEGTLEFNEKMVLIGGQLKADMTSLTDVDLEGDSKKNLEGHLKSDDFFGVEKFPESTIKFRKVKKVSEGKYKITADLTIKGKTSPVTFNADIKNEKSKFEGTAEVAFDRTVYDIRYNSSKFFPNLGDKIIKDLIKLEVKLVTE